MDDTTKALWEVALAADLVSSMLEHGWRNAEVQASLRQKLDRLLYITDERKAPYDPHTLS